jgi:respiratory nitrate reductase gamma subunit/nitrate reductase molybdenum cofactor assembly chaperone
VRRAHANKVFGCAAVMLSYPDEASFTEDLAAVGEGLGHLPPSRARSGLELCCTWLRGLGAREAAEAYVEAFDMRRRRSLYLTYYRYGDTRERGLALAALADVYVSAGFALAPGELPDFLQAVLELAASHPAGHALLVDHRPALAALREGLQNAAIAYWGAVDAVCEAVGPLGRAGRDSLARYRHMGPPAERVGLEAFAPPEVLGRDERRNWLPTVLVGILPYLALATFVIGHIWRYRYDQFGWTSRSTELQEKKLLKWGAPLFHYGTFAAIAGHIIGILVPERWRRDIGIPEQAYRWFSASAGTLAAVFIVAGVGFLACRRIFVARVRATTSPVDWVALVLLFIVIAMGVAETVGVGLSVVGMTTAKASLCGSEGSSPATPT